MDKSAISSAVDALGRPTGPWRKYAIAEKRQIAEETVQPRASVALIARRRGINANLVFGWRRFYQQGLLTDAAESPPLLPEKVDWPTPDLWNRGRLCCKRPLSAVLTSEAGTGVIR